MFTQIIKNPQVESARKHYTKPGNPIVGALSIDQICVTATNPFFVNCRPVQCPHLPVRKALLKEIIKEDENQQQAYQAHVVTLSHM